MLNHKEVHNSETLNIQIDRHDQKSYLIELSKDCTKFDLNVECLENSFSKFFILNHAESACELNINMVLKQDANCQMGVLDLEKSPLKWSHYVDLKEQGAEYEILSGQLCQEHIEKVCDMEVRHNAPHTNGQMKNFAVLFDHGQYQIHDRIGTSQPYKSRLMFRTPCQSIWLVSRSPTGRYDYCLERTH